MADAEREARGREIGRAFARYGPADLAGLRDAFVGEVPDGGRNNNGTFEAAGFAFSADTWQPGRDGCCHLHVRPGRAR